MTKEEKWQKHYQLAKKYYEHNSDLEVGMSFKTIDGVNYSEDGFALGCWIHNQRQFYKRGKLLLSRKLLLEEIGMRFEAKVKEDSFDKNYLMLCNFFQTNKNLDIPEDFRTNKN